MIKNKIELLAPAGNLSILKTAVDAGADSIYLGLKEYSARQSADNFTIEELDEGVNYAHARSSKVFLAVNTLMSDSEFEVFYPTIAEAVNIGIDGLIVQDLAVITKLAADFPDVIINCSTQMNVYSADEFMKLKELGANRVVLPRELSCDEIENRTKVAAKYDLETEVFAHGAVCVCASGLCLFSAMNRSGTRSGNRGSCAQPCREEYSLSNDGLRLREGHLISPKDRDVTDYLTRLINAGVKSLKIEGRMRDANYVKSAVYCYRRLIDAYYDGNLNNDLIKEIKADLLVNFNRGGSFTSQYLSGNKDDRLLSGEYPGKYGVRIGRISRLDNKNGIVTVGIKSGAIEPDRGDFLSIRDNAREICSFPVGKTNQGLTGMDIKGLHPDMIKKLKPGFEVFLMNHDIAISKQELRRTPIKITLENNESEIIAKASVIGGIAGDITADTTISIPEDYDGKPLDKDRIIEQAGKTLDTPFKVVDVAFEGSDTYRCPVSTINNLRRDLLLQLEVNVVNSFKKSYGTDYVEDSEFYGETSESYGEIKNMYTYPVLRLNEELLEEGADIYAFSIYDLAVPELYQTVTGFVKDHGTEMVLLLPDFHHDKLNKIIDTVITNLKNDLGNAFIAVMSSRLFTDRKFLRGDLKHFASAGTNIYSAKSLAYAFEYADAVMPSYEVSADDVIANLRTLTETIDIEKTNSTVIIHSDGLIPWMQSDFCACGRNQRPCNFCSGKAVFDMKPDKKGENTKLLVVPHPVDCSCSIYGRPKNVLDQSYADAIADMGFNVICNYTILPGGQAYD
ncbi:putative protease [Ruminococcaceae bacterium YAD3003]|nr:putative protease [Ruminococcaceae bacterium YAD3003]